MSPQPEYHLEGYDWHRWATVPGGFSKYRVSPEGVICRVIQEGREDGLLRTLQPYCANLSKTGDEELVKAYTLLSDSGEEVEYLAHLAVVRAFRRKIEHIEPATPETPANLLKVHFEDWNLLNPDINNLLVAMKEWERPEEDDEEEEEEDYDPFF